MASLAICASPDIKGPLQELGYPCTDDPASAGLIVTTALTEEHRLLMLEGKQVLWMAENLDSLQTYLDHICIRPRQGSVWQGDWANSLNWLCQDRLFKDLPGDGIVNFAYADLTPEHVITGYAPSDFATHVQAGLAVGWLHKAVATVAERRVGRGMLLVSTFRLSEHLTTHPVASLMVREMIEYLGRKLSGRIR